MILKDWQDSYSVGIPAMDTDHFKMVQMIGSLYEAMKQGQSKTMLAHLITELYAYANEHCQREERHLKSTSHPDLDMQQKQHALFLNKMMEFKNNYDSGHVNIAVQMLPYLNEWFLNHIMKVDSNYKKT